LAAGEDLFTEGDEARTVAVLVEGELTIATGGVVVNRHTAPGTILGETGALLGQRRHATVTATAPTVVREIGQPRAFFESHPAVALEVARQLAGRLDRLTAYVADVQRQFGHEDDHLGVFGELLQRIAQRPPVDIEPGSDRSPDY
jgi:CRP-like cAMP-binding protein